ncbi:coiled-coil domain-containing protein 42-like [Polyodon spathula]|uniref:coiled-coil domain-containing protein 42-like n=1 Tax=Polyodon spathula TaxID=7913 RepID=UPI001B7EE232|nr:coiled-coil domain-containing protein 42-like [Polyodon spathula]
MAIDLSDYFKTFYRENLRNLLVKVPAREGDLTAQSTRLLEKRREVAHVHQAMESQREENEVKRLRAMKKAAQERELTNQKESDLAALQQEMTSLNHEREVLEKRVLRHAVFLRYLERVVQASEQFQEVRQVMSRYDTLVLTREDLLRTAQENQENMDRARAQLGRFLEEKNNVVLQYNNQLAQLQSRLDQARSDALLWESRWTHIQNTAAKKTLLLGTIKMATLNLYQTVCKRQRDGGGDPVPLEDTPKQLEKIQKVILDMATISEEVTKQEAAAASKSGPALPAL